MRLLNALYKSIFGYDVFISYSRSDSLEYAYALASHFQHVSSEPFLDQISATRPGLEISPQVIRAIRRSRGFVLIGSQGAQGSREGDPIPQEISTFLEANGQRFIVAINVGEAINPSILKEDKTRATAIEKLITGMPLVDESEENLAKHEPALEVLEKIKKQLNFTKKSIRLRYISFGILGIVLVLLALAGILSFKIRDSGKNLRDLQIKNDKITNQFSTLTAAFNRYNDSLRTARRKMDSTDKALAIEQALVVQTSRLKDSLKGVADDYQTIADARNIVNQAKEASQENPQLAAMLSLIALKKFDGKAHKDPIVVDAFREMASQQQGYAINDVLNGQMGVGCLSADETICATSTRFGGIALWDCRNKKFYTPLLTGSIEIDSFQVRWLQLSKDNNYLLGQYHREHDHQDEYILGLWEVSPAHAGFRFLGREPFENLAVSPDMSTIAFADTTDRVRVFRFDSTVFRTAIATIVTPAGNKDVHDIEINCQNDKLAIGYTDSLVLYCDIPSKNPIVRTLRFSPAQPRGKHEWSLDMLRFSPDSRFLLATPSYLRTLRDSNYLKIWDLGIIDTGRNLYFARGTEDNIADIYYGGNMITCLLKDGTIHAWATNNYSRTDYSISIEKGKRTLIDHCSFSRDGKYLLSLTYGGSLYLSLFVNSEYANVRIFNTPRYSDLHSNGGNFALITNYDESSPQVFDLREYDNQLGRILAAGTYTSKYLENNSILSIVMPDSAVLWDLKQPGNEKPIVVVPHFGKPNKYEHYGISADNRWIYTGTDSGIDLFYYDSTLHLVYSQQSGVDFEYDFSPDAHYLLEKSTDSIYLLGLKPGGQLAFRRPLADTSLDFSKFLFSKDDRWLLGVPKDRGLEQIAELCYIHPDGQIDKKIISGFERIDEDECKFSPHSDILVLAGTSAVSHNEFARFYSLDGDGRIQRVDSTLEAPMTILFSNNQHWLLYGCQSSDLDDNSAFNEQLTFNEFYNLSRRPDQRFGSRPVHWNYTLPIADAAFSPDENLMVTLTQTDNFNSLQLWRLGEDSAHLLGNLSIPGARAAAVNHFEFSPANRFLIIKLGDESPMICFDLRKPGKTIDGRVLRENVGQIKDYRFSKTGDSLYVIYYSKLLNDNEQVTYYLKRYDLHDPDADPEELLNIVESEYANFSFSDDLRHCTIVGNKRTEWPLNLEELVVKTEAGIARNPSSKELGALNIGRQDLQWLKQYPVHWSHFWTPYSKASDELDNFDTAGALIYLKELDKVASAYRSDYFLELLFNRYFFMGLYPSALTAINKAVAIQGSNKVGYYYEQGVVLAFLGRNTAAIKAFGSYLRLADADARESVVYYRALQFKTILKPNHVLTRKELDTILDSELPDRGDSMR